MGIEIRTWVNFEKTIHKDGVKITVSDGRFEVSAIPSAKIPEQQAIQQLRDWIRERNKNIV